MAFAWILNHRSTINLDFGFSDRLTGRIGNMLQNWSILKDRDLFLGSRAGHQYHRQGNNLLSYDNR
jgi:hypothetical protein